MTTGCQKPDSEGADSREQTLPEPEKLSSMAFAFRRSEATPLAISSEARQEIEGFSDIMENFMMSLLQTRDMASSRV